MYRVVAFCLLIHSIPTGIASVAYRSDQRSHERPYRPSYFVCKRPVNGISCQWTRTPAIELKSPDHVIHSPPIAVDTAIVSEPVLKLALNLGTKNGKCDSNSVVSPFSIATILTVLMDGSNRRTYSQIRKALGYSDGLSDLPIYQAYRSILQRLRKLDGKVIDMNVANGLFSQQPLTSLFNKRAEYYFLSQVQQLDLTGKAFASANQINRWVSRQTNGKISNILFSLPPETRLVAASAIYMKADWAVPFDEDATRDAPFYVSANETVSVPTMLQQNDVPYVEDPHLGCKMVALPYKGDELAMYLLLPTNQEDRVQSLNELERKLTNAALFHRLVDSMASKTTVIQLPKFRFKQKFNLKPMLMSMGVLDLFSAYSDLSRMMADKGVAVSDIVHQAYIDVTETGTEAAAVTLVTLNRNGPSRTFKANRPFLFFITDTTTKTVLFSGRVVRP